MAFVGTTAVKSVFGNVRVSIVSVAADSAAGSVVMPGLSQIYAATISPLSMATAAPHVVINKLESGTAAAGYVAITACASGDVFYVTAYGR